MSIDKKITQLSELLTAGADDVIPIVSISDNTTKKITVDNLLSAIVSSNATTGGTGSAGSGKQYIEMTVDGVTYKVLHDGTI